MTEQTAAEGPCPHCGSGSAFRLNPDGWEEIGKTKPFCFFQLAVTHVRALLRFIAVVGVLCLAGIVVLVARQQPPITAAEVKALERDAVREYVRQQMIRNHLEQGDGRKRTGD